MGARRIKNVRIERRSMAIFLEFGFFFFRIFPIHFQVEIQPDGSRNCGLCGDPVTDPEPRPNENGGIYAPTVILTRYFESGSTAEISIYNNYPNQLGFYEFRLCDNGTYTPTQECLDENLLFIEDSNDYKMPVPGQGLNRIQVQLPAGLTCSHCLLQWRFKKGTVREPHNSHVIVLLSKFMIHLKKNVRCHFYCCIHLQRDVPPSDAE